MRTGSFICERWTLTQCAGHTLQSYYEGGPLHCGCTTRLNRLITAGPFIVAGLLVEGLDPWHAKHDDTVHWS